MEELGKDAERVDSWEELTTHRHYRLCPCYYCLRNGDPNLYLDRVKFRIALNELITENGIDLDCSEILVEDDTNCFN